MYFKLFMHLKFVKAVIAQRCLFLQYVNDYYFFILQFYYVKTHIIIIIIK